MRIIPARAGFTWFSCVVRVCGWDHPRSRGVYVYHIHIPRRGEGSSPLARGLRRRRPGPVGGPRIIPARAGFTLGRAGPPPGGADHPRSRGVYSASPSTPSARPGSSPLARGLPGRQRGQRPGHRIIPARAGFTTHRHRLLDAARDHPRSRGVYGGCTSSRPGRTGSSPLARGLRRRLPEPGRVGRIIPARAGFTPPATRTPWSAPDHPRSRGVYREPGARRCPQWGSSPLARGLRGRRARQEPPERIIPARAGFTDPCGLPAPQRRDHPRSRGVYPGAAASRGDPLGSSPLARGLRVREPWTCWAVGIIPARAGFTDGSITLSANTRDHPRSRGVYLRVPDRRVHGPLDHPRSRGVYSWTTPALAAGVGSSPLARGLLDAPHDPLEMPGDHPRSRGVYRFIRNWCGATRGSSPLARGLLRDARRGPGGLRIIPARAGFTPCPARAERHGRDHPRSRGVYAEGIRARAGEGGSSPLARGLLHALQDVLLGLRIIPARAGFTFSMRLTGTAWRDHPRSRGVYVSRGIFSPRATGSSPLARGLRGLVRLDLGGRGIIPARAGFTDLLAPAVSFLWDHPRSRGVYSWATSGRTERTGSSPLARGLLSDHIPSFSGRRIIPARAGFTCSRRRRRPRPGDHPRSRGVYDQRCAGHSFPLGSSPLARGLPRPLISGGRSAGIIPARAGFTANGS